MHMHLTQAVERLRRKLVGRYAAWRDGALDRRYGIDTGDTLRGPNDAALLELYRGYHYEPIQPAYRDQCDLPLEECLCFLFNPFDEIGMACMLERVYEAMRP
jgi:hypothetical protein